MIKFKCDRKNFDVMVRLRTNGKLMNKYVHFNEKGEAVFESDDGINGRLIEKLRAEIGTESITGLREVRTRKTAE